MPSIAQGVANNQARIAAQNSATPAPTADSLVQPAATPPLALPSLDLPAGVGLPQRGMFPASLILASDRNTSNRAFRGPGTRSATFPFPSVPAQVQKTTQNITNTTEGTTVEIQVNNQDTPSQQLLNFLNTPGVVWSSGPNGQIYATVSASGDGLVHGTTPWEYDPSYACWREDFLFNRGSAQATSPYLGELGWGTYGATVTSYLFSTPSHQGCLGFVNTSGSANQITAFLPTTAALSMNQSLQYLPLLDEPGWKMTWIFGLDIAFPTSATSAFSTNKTSFYLGLIGGNNSSTYWGNRPNIFLGLRYDTDPGQTLSVTSVANHSGNTTVYTISGGSSTSNYYLGNQFTTTNCGNAANNGTFLCVASTSTTLTLQNAAGVSATGLSGSAVMPGIGDSTFHFEYVTNPTSNTSSYRCNAQGQTHDTGASPVQISSSGWYRLDISCTTAGTVTLTLSSDGSQLATWTVTCTTVSWLSSYADSFWTGTYASQWVNVTTTGSSSWDGKDVLQKPFALGSQVTVRGTPPVAKGISAGQVITDWGYVYSTIQFPFAVASPGWSGNYASYFTGFPAFIPGCIFGNDSESSPPTVGRMFAFDFFSLIWSPCLAASAPSVNAGYSRYFSGTNA